MANETRFIGYGRQTIEQEDVDAVVAALTSDYLTQGPAVPAFEKAIAEQSGASYAVAVSSATAALHVACLAAGLKAGELAATQPITFIASANCARYCGANVDLVDINSDTLMMAPEKLSEQIARAPQTKVVIPVSMGGLSSGGAALRAAAGPDRIVIEDASHSFGATDESGRRVGAGGWADMTVFSFHPVKPITTGEGGVVVTDDPALYQRLLLYRSHGIERAADKLVAGTASDPWWYEQQVLGYNYRLCDIQAALGASQARRIEGFLARRREIAAAYDAAFAGLPYVTLVQSNPEQRKRSGHHLYLLRIDFARIGRTRADVMGALRSQGVGTQVHYIPIYMQPFHAPTYPDGARQFPVSDKYYQETLTLPCFPSMSEGEVERVISAVRATVS